MVEGFRRIVSLRHGVSLLADDLTHEHVAAPHRPPPMRGLGPAVYVFSLRRDSPAPAGANRVLKVGKVGANSAPRFTYQHYNGGSAQSTLAGSIETYPILWEYLGVPEGTTDTGAWLKEHTDRNHFYLSPRHADLVTLLEVYVRALTGPVFEGSSRGGRVSSTGVTLAAES